MPTLPWTALAPVQAEQQYTVMASRLPLAHYSAVPAFLRHTLAIRRQLASTRGLVGYSLDADLLHKTFWTLSVWADRDALDTFAATDPHRDRVSRIRPGMRPAQFAFWTLPGTQLTSTPPVSWTEAHRRIAAP